MNISSYYNHLFDIHYTSSFLSLRINSLHRREANRFGRHLCLLDRQIVVDDD